MFLLKTNVGFIYSLVENSFPEIYDITWQCKIMIKDKIAFSLPQSSFIIVGTTEIIEDDPNNLFNFVYEREYFLELLKSNLQKCIRRGLAESAVRTAYQMIKQDIDAFLRRIINIIAEDSVIHPEMLYIMWLYMSHSKGYKITNVQVFQMLKIVYQVSKFNYYDVIVTDPSFFKSQKCDSDSIIESIDDKVIKIDHCCFSLLLRSIYGGLRNDIIFLRTAVRIWKDRMKNNKEEWCTFISNIWSTPENISDFNLNFNNCDKYDFSVDQHCFGDKFCERIKNFTKTKASIVEIKEAIWFWRSSYTNKMLMSDCNDYNKILIGENPGRNNGMIKTEKTWLDISDYVNKISYLYWK